MGTRTPEKQSWIAMITRCTNPRRESWVDYGGRGITVCDRWRHSFKNFLADMGARPVSTTLDRIDVNGNYEPSNCRWATPSQQSRNCRGSVKHCEDCKEDRPPYRRGTCHRCNEYRRRHGSPRPAVNDMWEIRCIVDECANCFQSTRIVEKSGLCVRCHRTAWARANRLKTARRLGLLK